MARWPYSDPAWLVVRGEVLERDGHRCRIAVPHECSGRATEVHHKVTPADGGEPFDPVNLVSSCKAGNIAERNIRRAAMARGERVGRRPSREW